MVPIRIAQLYIDYKLYIDHCLVLVAHEHFLFTPAFHSASLRPFSSPLFSLTNVAHFTPKVNDHFGIGAYTALV